MNRVVILLSIFVASPAFAQQPSSPQQSPREQALLSRITQEINGNLQCSEAVSTISQQLQDAKAKIADLEAKAAEKK